jgi:hypothetical protein
MWELRPMRKTCRYTVSFRAYSPSWRRAIVDIDFLERKEERGKSGEWSVVARRKRDES